MPYIKQEFREKVDGLINHLVKEFKEDYQKDPEFDKNKNGTANYILTRIILGILKPNQWNYESLMHVMGTLTCVQHEISRRIIGIYEDTKISQNGDVKEFGEFENFIIGSIKTNQKV